MNCWIKFGNLYINLSEVSEVHLIGENEVRVFLKRGDSYQVSDQAEVYAIKAVMAEVSMERSLAQKEAAEQQVQRDIELQRKLRETLLR